MQKEFRFREIPYNYTSFSDKEIIAKYFDDEAWKVLETLRDQRVTGRSAKLLYNIIGDIFIIERNPYIYEDFLRKSGTLKKLRRLHARRLETIAEHANGNEVVTELVSRTREIDKSFFDQFSSIKLFQARIRFSLTGVTSLKNVHFGPFHRAAHATDATDWRMEYPLVVVYPDTVEEIPKIVKSARKLKLSVIPRGGGTGLTGGAVPVNKHTMVINTEKLNHIGAIELKTTGEGVIPIVSVDAGVVTDDAIEFCAKRGYIFATDPTSSWASTIGGNISENAGGKKCVMWGTAIDNLYSFRLVDANGEVLEVRRNNHPHRKIQPHDIVIFDIFRMSGKKEEVVKTITLTGDDIRKPGLGKDITNKVLNGLPGLQKEGGDGVIISAQFVLYKPFKYCRTICLEFFGNNMTKASNAIVAIQKASKDYSNVHLTALEHFDEKYVAAINYRNKSRRTETPKAVLLIDVESNNRGLLEEAARKIVRLVDDYNAEAMLATDDKEREQFWSDRKHLGAIAKHTNAFKLNEDIVIPLERLPDFADFIEKLNFEKELLNVLHCIDHIKELIIEREVKASDSVPVQRLVDCKEYLTEVREKYQDYFSDLIDKNKTGEKKSIFRQLQDGNIRIEFDEDIVQYMRKMFHGYEQFLQMFEKVVAAERKRRIIIATHMHAGDGNVHVNIPVYSNDYLMMTEADDTAARAMKEAVRLGGVVSGEHGIGLTKLKFLEPKVLEEFKRYKEEADPTDLFNPEKLQANFPLNKIYTPSFNLLEREAIILEATDLEKLSMAIASCVRCGKCKSVCNTHHPARTMMYNPRNKIFGVGLITEAVLFYAQTLDMHSFKHFTKLRTIADYCTMCHKCVKPCPVKIDFGDVTLTMRRLLVERHKTSAKPMTNLALKYLGRKKYIPNKLFRWAFLGFGYSAQRFAYRLNKPFARITNAIVPFLAEVLKGEFPKSGRPALRDRLHLTQSTMLYSFKNPEKKIASSVVYFPGCGSERMFPEISIAAIAMLYEAGVRVVIPPEYLCCGYPFLANGKIDKAEIKGYENRIIFHRMADTIDYMNIDAVLVSCGTCFEMLEKYELKDVFRGATLIDVNEYIVREKLYSPHHIFKNSKTPESSSSLLLDNDGKILYHEPCHTPLNQFGANKTFELMFGIKPIDIPNCCGEAGTLALSRPDISNKLRDRKRENILKVTNGDPIEVLTTCPSCVLGLSKNTNGKTFIGKSLVVFAAEKYLGKNWEKDFLKKVKKNGVEKILF